MRNIGMGRSGLSRRARRVAGLGVVLCLLGAGVASAIAGGLGPFDDQQVGQSYANGVLLPTNQWVSPLGTRILDQGARLVSSSVSPDGKYLAALGWNDFNGYLTIYDLTDGHQVQQTELGSTSVADDYSVGADGPLWSPDGTTLWVPQSGDLDRFSVDASTGQATQAASIALCGAATPTDDSCSYGPTDAKGAYLPSGMALSPDGSKLYVALNGANTLGVIDTATNTLSSQIPVGNAPRQVVLADDGATAYVSNEGGRPARPGDFTNLSDGTPIVSSRSSGGAITGTVSVVNLTTGKEQQEIPVGLQPTALYQHGDALFVANSNDDSLSIIDERTDAVAQTVSTNPVPGVPKVGSYANAIGMIGERMLVSIGRDNAIAVYKYEGLGSAPSYEGLIPTDWYPVQVQPDPTLGADTIVVTNDKGIGARGPESTIKKLNDTKPAKGHNTYDDTGSITTFPMPTDAALAHTTHTVDVDNAWTETKPTNDGAFDTVPSVIPSHLGASSPIKHVVVIVKENRTYDQVLGDLGEGNGDPADAQFGASVTPNFHAMARRFGDIDNFYDEGTLSADGHNWIVQADANDYVEKEFGAFYRSYPSQGGDALAYQRDGFLWQAAERAGDSVRDFGEYAYNPYSEPPPSWDDYYKTSQILEGKAAGPLPVKTGAYPTSSDIPSLEKIIDPDFPNFQLNIPDQYRVDMWNRYFRAWKRSGSMPALQFMWLMSDHTAGAGSGDPYPVAEVADNDYAVGRVVSEISHSRFWRSTAIFVVEDDTQNGVDHVDGHRGPAFVISPYSKPTVDDDYYTQVNMVRTIEQILDIQPMNQEDGSTEPMYNAFTETPNFAPYALQAPKTPLTLGAPGYPATETASVSSARRVGATPAAIPASMRGVYAAWVSWSKRQVWNGSRARADAEKPALLNRYDWYSAHGWLVAYPGDARIYKPDQVPGRNLPAAYLGDD